MPDSHRDRLRILLPSLAVFLMTAGFVITKTARDALYIRHDGLSAVAFAFVVIAVLSVPQARLVLWAVARVGARRTRLALPLATAAAMVAYVPFATPGSSVANDAFFIAVPLAFSVLLSTTWLLAAELMQDGSDAWVAKGFSRVAMASMLGGSVGAATAGGSSVWVGPRGLIALGAGLLLASAMVTAAAHRRFPATLRNEQIPFKRVSLNIKGILRSPYVRLLMVIAVAGAFATVMIDFQFYAHVALSSAGREGTTTGYFAGVYFVVNTAALLFQMFIGSRFQRALGLAGALMVLPLVLFGGGGVLLMGGSYLLIGTGLRIAEGGLRSSVHRSNWEQAFVGIAQHARPIAKVVVDGMGARLSAGGRRC